MPKVIGGRVRAGEGSAALAREIGTLVGVDRSGYRVARCGRGTPLGNWLPELPGPAWIDDNIADPFWNGDCVYEMGRQNLRPGKLSKRINDGG